MYKINKQLFHIIIIAYQVILVKWKITYWNQDNTNPAIHQQQNQYQGQSYPQGPHQYTPQQNYQTGNGFANNQGSSTHYGSHPNQPHHHQQSNQYY